MTAAATLRLLARATESPYINDDPARQYGYVPSISLAVVFLVVFGITSLLHLVQLVISRRYWWMVCMVIGGVLEVLGWAARLWAHWAPLSFNAYVMQICCLIIAPTFYSASLYWAGGLAIAHVAPQKSWLSGNAFKITFIIADVVSLVVQAVGGGMAGSAVGTTNVQQGRNGSNIMLAGIVIQLAVMVFYVAYMAFWAWRAKLEVKRAGRKFQIMLLGMLVASIGIIVRGCYRTPELEEGFSGWIAQQQIWQLFDAIPVAFASYVLNIVHPHWYLVYPAEVDAQLPFSEKPYYANQAADATDRPASETTVADRAGSTHSFVNVNPGKLGHQDGTSAPHSSQV
ncbi:hypothetical protein JCM10908_003161 [Rhodotorula pacifica]|uniref:RTA1 domain-containing protein n=1 Tax=Rhodotorula pacifica TaxID=1495444 RepID=UPI00316D6904